MSYNESGRVQLLRIQSRALRDDDLSVFGVLRAGKSLWSIIPNKVRDLSPQKNSVNIANKVSETLERVTQDDEFPPIRGRSRKALRSYQFPSELAQPLEFKAKRLLTQYWEEIKEQNPAL